MAENTILAESSILEQTLPLRKVCHDKVALWQNVVSKYSKI